MKTKKHSFNVMLSKDEFEKMTDLGKHLGMHRSQVVRTAILNRWEMTCKGNPLCADGTRCRVAHLHPPVPRAPGQGELSERGSDGKAV